MIRIYLIGLGGASLALGSCVAMQKPASQPPRVDDPPGAHMALAYNGVFNDLDLLREKGPGASRVPFNPLDSHGGLVNARESESAVLTQRAKLLAVGWVMEEGVFALNRDRWRQVAEREKSDARMNAQPTAQIYTTFRDRLSKVAMWSLNITKRGDPKLFNRTSRSKTVVDKGLLDFADESVAAIDKNPGKAYTKKVGDWQLYASAIFANHQKCLQCHTKAKLGGPLAVAAFAYKKRSP